MKTICLVMIVKNESGIITRCLESVKNLVDYWVVCDTGSTDNTPEIIADFMQGVPGELHHREWVNFSHNRNEALQLARDKADYSLLVDADYVINVHEEFKHRLEADTYLIRDDGKLDYQRDLLVSNRNQWTYYGVTHEYIHCDTVQRREKLPELTITHYGDGGNRKDKFTRDLELLTKALEEEPENKRYMFYLAQTYKDMGDHESALEWYNRRVDAGGWAKEVWYSMYQAARMQHALGVDWSVVNKSYVQAFVFQPTRFEPLYEIARYYRRNEEYDLGFLYAKMGMDMPYPDDIFLVHKYMYDYGLPLEFSRCSRHLGKHSEALKICKRLLAKKDLPTRAREVVLTERELNLVQTKPSAAVSKRQDLEPAAGLENQQWQYTGEYDVLGGRVLVRSNSLEFVKQSRRLLRSFPQPTGDGTHPDVTLSFSQGSAQANGTSGEGWYVYYNQAQVGYTPSFGKLFQLLEWQLTFSGDELAQYFLLHAGAVSKNGAGIILPGVSKSGKSSLTMALARENYGYLSDEIAAIDPSTGTLHAFPRAVGIRDAELFPDLACRDDLLVGPEPGDEEPVWWVHPKEVVNESAWLRPHITPVRYIHMEDVTSKAPGESAPLKYIIFPKYHPNVEPQIQPLGPAEALSRLFKSTRNTDKFGNDSLHILAPLVSDAQCFSLESNDLRASVRLINDLVGA